MTDQTSSGAPASSDSAQANGEDKTVVHFATQRIFVKDLSFEAPNNIVPTGSWKPKISQDLNTSVDKVGEDLYEVVLNLTITVSVDEEKTAFLIEVHQAGLFSVKGLEGLQLQRLLSSQCPSILFPYARETIDSMAVKGGFPPLMLPPINFDALYMQALSEARKQQAGTAEGGEAQH